MTFDSLMTDSSSFLLPVSATPMSGIGTRVGELNQIRSFVQALTLWGSRENAKSNPGFSHLEGFKIHHVEVWILQLFFFVFLWKFTSTGKRTTNFPSRRKPCQYSKREKLLLWVRQPVTFSNFAESKDPIICTVVSSGTKKKIPRFLLIESGVLVIAEPDARSASKNPNSKSQQSPQSTGVVYVCNTIPLQNIEVNRSSSSIYEQIRWRWTNRMSAVSM